jgi:hypothetical protein
MFARASKCVSVSLLVTLISLAGCAGDSSSSPVMPNDTTGMIKQLSSSCPCLYVANGPGNSVTVYASGATGNAKPLQDISGSSTGLSAPYGVAVDGSGNIYVTNNDDVITIYAPGATGNVAPIRSILGSAYHEPKGIAIDPINGDIYVAKAINNAVVIYAPNASGKASPIGSILGSATGLDLPKGVALDASANIYVTNSGNNSVTVYAAGSTGNVAPVQTIAGSRTGLDVPYLLAVDSSKNIYVPNIDFPNPGNGSLTVYAAGSNGNVAPTKTIEGAKTKLNLPAGIALDSSDNIYASNFDRTDVANSSITVYAAGSNGNKAPAKTISGNKTGLDGPQGIVIH